jgi:hypothetical protein
MEHYRIHFHELLKAKKVNKFIVEEHCGKDFCNNYLNREVDTIDYVCLDHDIIEYCEESFSVGELLLLKEYIKEEINNVDERILQEYIKNYTEKISKKINGSIYIIKDNTNNTYKIGCSKKPKERIKTLQTSTSNSLSLIYAKEVEDMYISEKVIHDLFNGKRLASEWFSLTEEDINNIKSLYV